MGTKSRGPLHDERHLHKLIREAEKREATDPEQKYVGRVTDSRGLYLLHVKRSVWSWRLDYRRPNGRRNTLGLGVYEETSLVQARDARARMEELLSRGIDPAEERVQEKQSTKARAVEAKRADQDLKRQERGLPRSGSLREVFPLWVETKRERWSEHTRAKLQQRIEKYVFPTLGDKRPEEIDYESALACLESAQQSSVVQAHRVRVTMKSFGVWAKAQAKKQGLVIGNVWADELLPEAMSKTPESDHRAALTKPQEYSRLAEILAGIDADEKARPQTKVALKVIAATAQRSLTVRSMRWADVDFENRMWRVPASLMKGKAADKKSREDHLVPLAEPVIEWIESLRPFSGAHALVFGNERDPNRPMNDGPLRELLLRIDPNRQQSVHGFRAVFETLGQELLDAPLVWLELQLGHAQKDANGRAYNRAAFIDQRIKHMARWGRIVADACAGRPIPRKADVQEKPALTLADANDVEQLVALFERATGQRVSAAALRKAAAALAEKPRQGPKRGR